MNIAFDAVAILGPMSKNRGIGNYALSQFTRMIDRDEENRYFLLNMIEKDFSLSDKLRHPERLSETFFDTGAQQVLLRNADCADAVGAVIRRWLKENNIDIFYITSPFESAFTMYKKEWFEGVRVVSTVYDIIPYVLRDQYLTDKTTYSWYMSCIENLRWSDRLLVISESVRSDMKEYLGFDESRIDVIWGAVDEIYEKKEIPEDEKQALFNKFGITKPFVMCTGGEDRRKNLDGLIRAFAMLPEKLRREYQLVIVCKLSEDGLKRLSDEAVSCGVENDVVFTNFVTSEELLYFYNLAVLLAFPSKYEGFGLPIVEAWGCGTPVLTSDNSSLAQIGGDAAKLVDASSDKRIAQGLEELLSSPELLQELTEKGIARLEKFRWDTVADAAVNALNSVEPLPRSDGNGHQTGQQQGAVAMFTPLPPVKSGISEYSEDIISAMSRFCDIDVFIDKGYTPSCSFPENVHIYPHSEYEKRRGSYSRTFYQMGNSEYHFYMYPYIRKYHGIVVLHDSNLHGAAYHYAMGVSKGDSKLYEMLLCEDYPAEQVGAYINALKNGSCHPKIYEMPVNGFVTAYADRVVVHSEAAKREILRLDISRNAEIIPSYAEILPLQDAAECRRKAGLDPDCTLISAFGFIHETKRTMPILRAFARLHSENPKTRLLFAGKPSDTIKEEMEHFISENNLSEAVTVTGFIDIEQFKAYIDMTDICLNLRHPSNGETSGSLMRILAKGKCVVVNDIGSFSEFPDEICVKLPAVAKMGERNEVRHIYDTLSKLISNPDYARSVGAAARSYSEEFLDINKVVRQYAEISAEPFGKCCVTEEMLEALRSDSRLHTADMPGIAETLAYGKEGC